MKTRIFTFNLALFLFAVAFIGTGMRQVENGNYTAAGFAGMGLAAVVVATVIRIRNAMDRKAVTSKG
jgi:hypothetical protein